MPPSDMFPPLHDLARRLLAKGPHKTSPTSRRVRALFNGRYIFDTTSALHVWEHPYFPQLYIPVRDLAEGWEKGEEVSGGEENGEAVGKTDRKQGKKEGGAYVIRIKAGEKQTDKVIGFQEGLEGPAKALAGLCKVDFGAVDQWYEEDTPIFVHPKDPFKRVDILPSTRPIKVAIDDHPIASSPHSTHLLETDLPTRYYLPPTCIDQSLLRPSDTRTKCPYKGEAEYYSVEVGGKVYKDVVWYYRTPTRESAPVEGLCCFYNEKVDIWLDGKKLERPKTPFS